MITLVSGLQHSDSTVLKILSHFKLLLNTEYIPCYVSIPVAQLCYTLSFVPFNPLSYCALPFLLPTGKHHFVFHTVSLFLFCYIDIYSFYF